jgi:hypothetical protein
MKLPHYRHNLERLARTMRHAEEPGHLLPYRLQYLHSHSHPSSAHLTALWTQRCAFLYDAVKIATEYADLHGA